MASLGCGHETMRPPAAPPLSAAPLEATAPSSEAEPVAREELAGAEKAEAESTPILTVQTLGTTPRLEVTPVQTLSVGKWPEGIAVTAEAIWVAESGMRRVTRFARGEKASGRSTRVGRLPVGLVLDEGGTPYAVVATDSKLVTIDPASGRVKTVTQTPDYPQAIAEDQGVLWTLLWHDNTSSNSSLLRVDPKSGSQQRSGELGPNAFDVAVGHGRVWVARNDGLTVVDAESLEKLTDVPLADRPMHVLSGAAGVYVATDQGIVRIEPTSMNESHRLLLGQRVSALALYADKIAGIDENGTVHLLDALTLSPQLTLVPPAFRPQAMVSDGDALFVTTHRGQGERGSVLVFRPQPSN
jgi:hypothetical protein